MPEQYLDNVPQHGETNGAVTRKRDESDLLKLSTISFDWRNSPRIDHGLIVGHPCSDPPTLELTLVNGRQIKLKELHQFYTYDGMLAGLPGNPERYFLRAINAGAQYFSGVKISTIILEPTFHFGRKAVAMGPKGEVYANWLKLPDICTVAEFESDTPAQNQCEIYSSLRVIWFQDRYGVPKETRTLDQLRNLDWERQATDWTP